MITKEKAISYFGGMHNFRFDPMLVSTLLAILNGLFISSFGGKDLMEVEQRESQLVISWLNLRTCKFLETLFQVLSLSLW
jgi:hypothetical protein